MSGLSRRERRRLKRQQLQEQGGASGAPLSVEMVPQDPPQPGVDAPPEQAQQVKTTRKMFMQLQSFAGPIPPPELLGQYEEVCPGSADRILTQFEEQGRHRRKIENRVVWNNTVSSILGQITGFVLLAGAIGGGVFLLYNNKPVEGLGSIVTAVVGAAWVLRKAEVERKRELAQKRDQEKRR